MNNFNMFIDTMNNLMGDADHLRITDLSLSGGGLSFNLLKTDSSVYKRVQMNLITDSNINFLISGDPFCSRNKPFDRVFMNKINTGDTKLTFRGFSYPIINGKLIDLMDIPLNDITDVIISEPDEVTTEPKLFTVSAGKYDGNDHNCKYSDSFATLDEAIDAYDEVSSYPWAYIYYKGRYLDLYRKGYEPIT